MESPVPNREVPGGDGPGHGLAGDEPDGGKGQPASGEMRQEFGDAASGAHDDPSPIVADADPAQVAQVQIEHIG